jgi:outer membrane protein assembly factor BamB
MQLGQVGLRRESYALRFGARFGVHYTPEAGWQKISEVYQEPHASACGFELLGPEMDVQFEGMLYPHLGVGIGVGILSPIPLVPLLSLQILLLSTGRRGEVTVPLEAIQFRPPPFQDGYQSTNWAVSDVQAIELDLGLGGLGGMALARLLEIFGPSIPLVYFDEPALYELDLRLGETPQVQLSSPAGAPPGAPVQLTVAARPFGLLEQWMYSGRRVELWSSKDGRAFEQIASTTMNNAGDASATWAPAAAGSYRIVALIHDRLSDALRAPLPLISNAVMTVVAAADAWPMYLYDASHSGWNRLESSVAPPLALKWSVKPTGCSLCEAIPVSSGDRVFVNFTNDGGTGVRVCALDKRSGGLVWSAGLPGTIAAPDSPVLDGGVLYVALDGLAGGKIHALSAATGAAIWQRSLTGRLWSTALLSHSNALSAIEHSASTSRARAFLRQTGAPLWQTDINKMVYGAPIIVGGAIVFAAGLDTIVALGTATGQELWRRPYHVDSWWHDLTGDAGSGQGLLYVIAGFPSQAMTAIRAATGEIAWTYTYGVGYASTVTPVLCQGKLYHIQKYRELDTVTAYLYVFDALSGSLVNRWQIPVVEGDYVFMTAANGILYVGQNQYEGYPLVRAFDSGTGALLWQSSEAHDNINPIVVAHGQVYVCGGSGSGATAGHLLAYGPAPSSAAETTLGEVAMVVKTSQEGEGHPRRLGPLRPR